MLGFWPSTQWTALDCRQVATRQFKRWHAATNDHRPYLTQVGNKPAIKVGVEKVQLTTTVSAIQAL